MITRPVLFFQTLVSRFADFIVVAFTANRVTFESKASTKTAAASLPPQEVNYVDLTALQIRCNSGIPFNGNMRNEIM